MSSQSGQEIEAKFAVADQQTFEQLLLIEALGPFRLLPAPAPEQQYNIYYDTADARLRAVQYGFRIREVAGKRIATLKGPTSVTEGVHSRSEWEAVIGDSDPPEGWQPSEVRERLLALTGGAPLLQLLVIHTTRQHIYALRNSVRVVELSLDQGQIRAGGRSEDLRELELELLPGSIRADLDLLVALLRERFVLVPEERTKLARGLALLEGS